MTKTVFGVFADRNDAENAVNQLQIDGIDAKDISIVIKDLEEMHAAEKHTGANVATGATTGAGTGALVGGLAGLAASTLIPGLGAFFIGGPLMAALGLTGAGATIAAGAATGAVAGGFVGALTALGVTEKDAREYERLIDQGNVLVAAPEGPGEVEHTQETFRLHNASSIKTVNLQS